MGSFRTMYIVYVESMVHFGNFRSGLHGRKSVQIVVTNVFFIVLLWNLDYGHVLLINSMIYDIYYRDSNFENVEKNHANANKVIHGALVNLKQRTTILVRQFSN